MVPFGLCSQGCTRRYAAVEIVSVAHDMDVHAEHNPLFSFVFCFNDPAPTEIYTLSLHDALPIFRRKQVLGVILRVHEHERVAVHLGEIRRAADQVHFLQVVVGAQAEVVLARTGNRIHGEAEGDVAAPRGGRAALDVAHLVDGAVVLDHVAFLYVGSFHGFGAGNREWGIGNGKSGTGRQWGRVAGTGFSYSLFSIPYSLAATSPPAAPRRPAGSSRR